MKFFLLFNNIVKKEKPALLFFLKLLLLLSAVKCIFFFYNYRIAGGWSLSSVKDFLQVLKWAFIYDSFSIVLINFPLLLLLMIGGKLLTSKTIKKIILLVFTVLNTVSVFLNTADIFYFRFHLQRADADLFYVLRNPFENGSFTVLLVIVASVAFCIMVGFFVYKNLNRIAAGTSAVRFYFTNALLLLFCLTVRLIYDR